MVNFECKLDFSQVTIDGTLMWKLTLKDEFSREYTVYDITPSRAITKLGNQIQFDLRSNFWNQMPEA